MRRSGREAKKPDIFTFAGGDGGEHIRHDETDEEDNVGSSQPTSRRQQKKQIVSAAKRSGGGVGGAKLLDIISASRNVTSEVTAWIDGYKEDRVTSMAALVNFVLLSAGAGKEWVAYDVDLEALEPEELDVLLADMMRAMSESENSKDYPLIEKSKSKGAKSFRDKYRAFWIAWVEKLLALPRERGGKRVVGHEILRTVVDQLVALSSMAVVNVRDAVAEAALSVSEAVLTACAALRTELETAKRQIAAEESSRSKAQAQQNPRYLACVQQRDTVTKDLETLTELTSTVFNSVLLHRVQDFHDEVRATASRHLLDFVRFDLKRPIHVEYLKYLGRACSDYAAQVRMEAVCAIRELVEDADVVPYLTEFVAVFMDRFVDIASRDIDDNVALEMIETLRAMQKAGLLDSISEEKLDVVDVIVFDVEASARVRQEALAFLMDHTEGFDEDADEDAAAAVALDLSLASLTGKATKAAKGKGGAEGKADQAKALARRQRTAQQLETLTEYAAHHLNERFDLAHMLAEACLALRKHGIVYNWSVEIALLLRETDDVITFSLLPAQAAILLRMFVHCAMDLNAKRRALADVTSLTAAEKQTVQWWEALNESLQAHLPALLTHYKDDEAGLAVLVDLLPCVDYASEERACKAAQKVVLELVEITRDEAVLGKLAAALAAWTRLGGVVGGSVTAAVRMLVRDVWKSSLDCSAQLQEFIRSREADQGGSASSGNGAGKKSAAAKRKSKSSAQSEKDEIVLGLQRSLVTLKAFWTTMDCRRFLDENVDTVIDELTEVSDRIPTFAEGEATQLTPALADACIAVAQSVVDVINTSVLWSYKDVFDVGCRLTAELNAPVRRKPASKKARSSASEMSDETAGDDASAIQAEFERNVSIAVDTVIAQREKLLDIVLTWIEAGADRAGADDSTALARVQRAIRVKAYQVISNLRNFFPERETKYQYIDRLAYVPSSEVLKGVRRVFDSEGDRIKRQLSALQASGDADNEEAVADLSRSLIECVLEPVSKNLIYDVENLNRKQAASVLYYLIDSPHPIVEDNIKGFMRQLKESSLLKYMQVQLVALRDWYALTIGTPLQARIAAEMQAEAGETDFDFEGNDQVLQEGHAKLDVLARKLAQSLGVGKLKADAMDTLMTFLKACVDYAVKDVTHAGFAGCLLNYLRFLLPVHQRELQDCLAQAIESNPALADELADLRERGFEDVQEGRYLGFAKLLEFLERLEGKSRPKMTARRRPSNAPSQRGGDHSMDLSPAAVGRVSTSSAITLGGKHAGALRVKGVASQFASQALLDEDLELIGRGSKATGGGKAPQRPTAKPTARGASKPPVKGKGVTVAKGRGKKRRAEESSEEEEEEGEEGSDEEEDAESEGERDGYEGLQTGATRRYQQRFTQGLSATQPTQTQPKEQSQSQSRGGKRGAAKPGPARQAPAVVMGLDIEDISEEEEEEDDEEAVGGRKRAKVGNGKISGGRSSGSAGKSKSRTSASSRVSDEIEEEDSDAADEEGEGADRGRAAGGSKRPYAAVRGGSSGGSEAGTSFAELDSIPSRRRLRH